MLFFFFIRVKSLKNSASDEKSLSYKLKIKTKKNKQIKYNAKPIKKQQPNETNVYG